MRRRRTTVMTRLAVALALCVLALRTAVPAGFMLADTTGAVRLVPCDGMGPMPIGAAMAMPHHGSHHTPSQGEHDKGGDHPCAFSAAAFAPDVPIAAIAMPPLLRAAPSAALAIRETRPGAGLAAPPPWQTGPPALA